MDGFGVMLGRGTIMTLFYGFVLKYKGLNPFRLRNRSTLYNLLLRCVSGYFAIFALL